MAWRTILRKVLYWILFPACAISVGAFWPIHEAVANPECKNGKCEVDQADYISLVQAHADQALAMKRLEGENAMLRGLDCTARAS